MENIELMIDELDMPSKQVMIKVIIVQVDHGNMTSLGVQLSSDSSKWSTLDHENAITARNVLSLLEKHGALVFGAGGDAGSRSEITVGADITVLLDFLVKELDARILNQQTLWTKDNEEAEFFKDQRVGFQTRVSISDTGGRARKNAPRDPRRDRKAKSPPPRNPGATGKNQTARVVPRQNRRSSPVASWRTARIPLFPEGPGPLAG